ncbi:MAG: prolyl aminopeptidase [Hyphomicrobiaceae bacterium]|nr:prolyl aminopeptidase [Hyphomicrobiaceae bacterium]
MQARERYTLYPPIEPFRQGRLAVTDGHDIYFEQSGNPAGQPVVVIHGGPGGASNPTMRRFHDPSRYHIILFDQRGCGRSLPHASLDQNTTWDLVADMERLRLHLGVQQWQLFGGSWGSTLALIYAQTHPSRVLSLILRGIFMLRPEEILWFYQDGAKWLFPDSYSEFERPIPLAERGDMVRAYYQRLTHSDRSVQIAAARAWSIYEGSTLSLIQDPERLKLFSTDQYAIAFARIECHYFVHGGFLEHPEQVLKNSVRLKGLAATVAHGRYDVVTPLKNAFDLKTVWPDLELRIVPDAGHAMTEPGMIHELIAATRRHQNRI